MQGSSRLACPSAQCPCVDIVLYWHSNGASLILRKFEALDHRRPQLLLSVNKIGDLFRRVVARCRIEVGKFLRDLRFGNDRAQIRIDFIDERRGRARWRDQHEPA